MSVELDFNQYRTIWGKDLTKEIPDRIGELTELIHFDINSNAIGGSIPESMKDLKKLEVFVAYGNDLEGEIPEGLASLPNLRELDLARNQLSGSIPDFEEGSLQPCNLDSNLCYESEKNPCYKGGFLSCEAIRNTEEDCEVMLDWSEEVFWKGVVNGNCCGKNGITCNDNGRITKMYVLSFNPIV